MSRIVVTGGNRGIGKEIVKELVEAGHEVMLTARNEKKGSAIAKDIGAIFYELDVSSESSIHAFTEKLKENVESIDVLINNAGIFIDGSQDVMNADLEIVQETINTNVYGPWKLIQALYPLLKKSGDPRIVNISSGMGAIKGMTGDHPAYRMSKTALNVLTLMVHDRVGDEIIVNSMCPGWVRTDMGGSGAHRSVQKGAETAIWLATHPETPNGKFLRDKEVIEW